MTVYFLEIYNDKTSKIPEFGLCFLDLNILIDFTENKFGPISKNIKRALEELAIGWTLSLYDNGKIKVSEIPLIKHVNNKNYDKYIITNKDPEINNVQEEIKIPSIPKSKNALLNIDIKQGNTLVDFDGILNRHDPLYLLKSTFEQQQNKHRNPWTGAHIKSRIKTRKVKLSGQA